MREHRTYKKENVIPDHAEAQGSAKQNKEGFIWSYIIRPVRKGE